MTVKNGVNENIVMKNESVKKKRFAWIYRKATDNW